MNFLIIFISYLEFIQRVRGLIELKIGVILHSNDNVTRKVLTTAIQMANKDLEKINYRLMPVTETVNKNKSFNIIRKGCNLLKLGLVAYISPVDDAPSRHLSSLASKFHIPHMVTSCRFPDSTKAYPFDIRVNPDCDQYASLVYDYITKVEAWSSIIIVHAEEDSILKFENLLNQFESKLKMRHWKHHDLENNKMIMRDMSKKSKHHHILVDLPYWQITDFLIMASVHSMTAIDFTFVFTDWDTNLVDLASFKINNEVNITTFSILNETVIKEYRQKDEAINITIASIIEAESSAKKADIFPNFLSNSAIIFDAISILSQGIMKLAKLAPISVSPIDCEKNDTWKLGIGLVNSIKSVDDFYGLTGKIEVDEQGLRTNYNLSIYSLTEEGFEQSGYFAENQISLFPPKKIEEPVENSTMQPPLRVTTIIGKPFVYYSDEKVNQSDYDTDISMWAGYCIDLLKHIGQDLNLNFSIRIVADGVYGNKLDNEFYPNGKNKWNGMIGELIEKKADLAVAPMTITYERERVVDFSTPYMSLGLSILFKKPKKEAPSLFSFLSPLSPPVWGYVIGAYLGVSLILYVISHVTPYEWLPSHPCDDSSEKENQFNFLNSLWFAVGALVQQGCEIAPQASSTRIISGAWWFFTLIIISTYTANLAAFLTVEMFIVPIKSVEDLAKQKVIKYGTIRSGSSEAFFERAQIDTYKIMNKFMKQNPSAMVNKTDDGVNRVIRENGKYAFLLESAMSDFYRQRNCDLMKVGDPLDSKGYGIGFPTASKLRDQFTESILMLQKSQVLDALKRKWWNEKNISEPCTSQETSSAPASLNVAQVGGVFVLLGVGFVLAFIISILELYFVFRKQKLDTKIPFSKYFCKEMKFAMRFMSSSKKPKKPAIANGGYNIRNTPSREKLSLLDHRFSSGVNLATTSLSGPSGAGVQNRPSMTTRSEGGEAHQNTMMIHSRSINRINDSSGPTIVTPGFGLVDKRSDGGVILRKQLTLDSGGGLTSSNTGENLSGLDISRDVL